jgi:hypothetical protein
MTPEQRLDRAERILIGLAKAGYRARREFRDKVNMLIDAQIRYETTWRAQSEAVNEQIKSLAVAQAELNKSQKLTDQALRALIGSLRKSINGQSSN